MKCLISHLFKSLFAIVLLLVSATSIYAGNRDDLYTKGIKAYEENDYVSALKNLYAFYIINEKEIDAKPDFKKKLKERISKSESILKLSFASNPSIQKGKNPKGKIHFRINTKIGGGFAGTAIEIEDLLKNKTIDLNAIQELNHKTLTMPSSGYSR